MDTEELSTRKRVSVSKIKPGMYVVSLDQSWFQTPFYFHRRLIKNAEEIEQLKKLGIREVVIDTTLGADVDFALPDPAPASTSPVTNRSEPIPPHRPSLYETALQPLVEELETARTIHAEAVAAAQ